MNALQLNAARTRDGGTGAPALPVPILLLLGAVAAGIAAQGGYYAVGRALVTLLAGAACAVTLRGPVARALSGRKPARVLAGRGLAGRGRAAMGRGLGPVLVTAAAFCLWAAGRGVAAGAAGGAVGTVATVACLVAAVTVLLDASVGDRVRFADALLWAGAAVAVTSWAGVAWRLPRFVVLVEGRVWRGSGMLTYPNAAAALLATTALVGIALPATRGAGWHRVAAGYLTLVGLGATLSRAGILGLLAGLAVLVPWLGLRVAAGRLVAPALGAFVAVAALAPSFSRADQPHPGAALLGLAAGAVVTTGVTAGPALMPGRLRSVGLAGLVLAAAGAGAAMVGRLDVPAMRPVLDSRWTLSSFGRSEGTAAALDMVRAYPLAGTGVGQARLLLPTPEGGAKVALYVHDEYLQVLVDLGAVGLALLLALLAALAWTVWTGRAGRRSGGAALRAGAVAALVALAVHSGFDFLWHITVLPLLAGALVGLSGREPRSRVATGDNGALPGAGHADAPTVERPLHER